MPAPITFVVTGVRSDGETRGGPRMSDPAIGRLKASVSVTAQRAARGGDVRMDAVPGEDAVVVHVAGGPELWLHPEHARELLLAQHDPATRERDDGDGKPHEGEVRVPSRLQWRLEAAAPSPGATRGFLGDVLVSAVDVVTDLVEDKAADFVASKVVEHFDGRVTPGVYKLDEERLTGLRNEKPVIIADSSECSLVLVHGTFSETSGTFGKLWAEHPQLVRELFKSYEGRVYGLDHPTLGVSPIANAITLAEAAPKGARLHLLTHSRGGLVAEVLARVAAQPDDAFSPFDAKGYAAQRKELARLASIVKSKQIKVERIVRVACPSRGTLLASKRLDAYVSVVKWSLELAGLPVVPELMSFLGEVARRRADPASLPGLAAQIPDSPLVQWLHATDKAIDGDLRVIAGDIKGDSVVTWVKTLLSDAFFWTDNDLVVQTRSMYGGTPRAAASTFFLDQGGNVTHFKYFANPETAEAIVNALVLPDPDGFRMIGPLSWGGTSATGVRAALPQRSRAEAAKLPALFVLPGILGSNLRVGKDRIWLGWRLVNGLERIAYSSGKKGNVEPDGPISMFYDDVAMSLSEDHDVVPFAFDWRRPIEDEAARLAEAVDAALEARAASGQPVRMLAHSMGGLVARTMQLTNPATWNRMMKVDGARILMLGTPNGGSWAPMEMLSGDDTRGNLLIAVGAPFRGNETRQLIAQFPGLLQLQAGLLDKLGTEATWRALAKADREALEKQSIWHRLTMQLNQLAWGIPSQDVLTAAATLRRRLDKQRDDGVKIFGGKLLLVVGKAGSTTGGYELRDSGVVYFEAPDKGDGTVPLQSALLPGVETWSLDCEHGNLPRRREAFDAYRELLKNGTTKKLTQLTAPEVSRGAVASSAAIVRPRASRSFSAGAPPQRELEVLASADRAETAAPSTGFGAALQITVVNGDLTYIANPLLIGHYRSSRLTGAEAAMDRAIGGTMSASLRRNLYPVEPGAHQIFMNRKQALDNPWLLPCPAAVIVAGLGDEGELRGADLVQTVRQAVIAWGQRVSEKKSAPALFSLATTLLGSGGSGVSAGQAAQLIAQGVREANEQLSGERNEGDRWPRLGHLQIIELYLDRAADAWRALQTLVTASPALFAVAPVIQQGVGALRRPPEAGYRGADYDFISALVQRGEDQEERIAYSIDTKRARSEVRSQTTQATLIRKLVAQASSNTNADPDIGGTLFRLLVPVDLEPFMGSSSATVIEVDRGTAGIPWEILDQKARGTGDDRPWAIRTKLLRKLRVGGPNGRTGDRTDATADDNVLVIGDPACDRTKYPKLYGARREATVVAQTLAVPKKLQDVQKDTAASKASKVRALISPPDGSGAEPDTTAVVNAVEKGDWRIIHIAAHGDPPLKTNGRTNPRGVVLSDDAFLGPDEIRALRVIPELVFVNCCHLARTDVTVLEDTNYDRALFASGVAEALISAGVRCVVAAGWAVDDGAACEFARTFYEQLSEGSSFIDAVAAARAEAHALGGNTWAAYQCYGDPDWKYRRDTGDAQRPTPPPPSKVLGGIASAAGLVLALDTLAVRAELASPDQAKQLRTDYADQLRYLEQTFARYWRTNGEVAGAFGTAWAKLKNFDEAIKWYERARTAPDGGSSVAAIEQLASLKIRRAGARGGSEARQDLEQAMRLLDSLLAIGPTVERESLYGSAYKRLALLEAAAEREAEERAAIASMRDHYAAAEAIALNREKEEGAGTVNVFYPAMNRIAAQLAIEPAATPAAALDADTLDAVRRSMSAQPRDFWSVVGQTELSVYASMSACTLAKDLPSLTAEFHEHAASVSAPKMWASVFDNARFVLPKYQKRVSADEAEAAGQLLRVLAKLAGETGPAATTPSPPRGRVKAVRGRRPGRPRH